MNNAVKDSELDSLSALNDSLLLHILSLLNDTKIAIQTCVLSKRWRYLWTQLRYLHLDGGKINKPSFRKFVRHLRNKREASKIQTLRFYREHSVRNFTLENRFMDKFSDYAATVGVEELDTNNEYFFLKCCKALTELRSIKIKACSKTLSMNYPVFGSITRLHLDSISLLADGSDSLFSRCVNLEELALIGCRFIQSQKFITISSPNLVKLTISLVNYDEEIIVSAPRLLELNLIDILHKRMQVSVDDCPFLQKVGIRNDNEDKTKRDYFNKSFLERIYKDVIKNIISKTKSLVVQHTGWKWIFTKCNNAASVEIFAPKIDRSIAKLTWKMNVESDWNEVDFVEVFGKVVFVSYPAIISILKRDRLDQSLSEILGRNFVKVKRSYVRKLIEAELPLIKAVFKEANVNWKCNITRTLDSKIVWKMQWPK